MQLTNYYWYFQSAIPHRICDDIVKYGKSIQDQMAITGGYGDKKLNQKPTHFTLPTGGQNKFTRRTR